MKKILTASVLAITGAFCMNASAQNTGTVAVTVTLTPKCVINSTANGSVATIAPIGLTYTSFQSTVSNASSSFTVNCATGLAYIPSISAGGAGAASNGIQYFSSLSLSSAVTGLTASTLALGSLTGAASTTLYVNTTAPSGQAGATGTPVAEVRTVTLTF